MRRMHIHVGVKDLEKSIRFYSALFATQPVKTKNDYAKWMLDDPRINFAISTRSGQSGVDHLGLQVDDDSQLQQLRERLKSADLQVDDEGETVCCYAHSDKSWVMDPSDIAWEAFVTMEDAETYSALAATEAGACCTPETKGQPDCCEPTEKTTGCCG